MGTNADRRIFRRHSGMGMAAVLDLKEDRTLTCQEFRQVMLSLDEQAHPEDIDSVFTMLDFNGTGNVNQRDFLVTVMAMAPKEMTVLERTLHRTLTSLSEKSVLHRTLSNLSEAMSAKPPSLSGNRTLSNLSEAMSAKPPSLSANRTLSNLSEVISAKPSLPAGREDASEAVGCVIQAEPLYDEEGYDSYSTFTLKDPKHSSVHESPTFDEDVRGI